MAQPQPFMKWTVLAVVLVSLLHLVQSQINPAFTRSPANNNSWAATGTNIFYLDSNSDCNGGVRELFSSSATIKGNDPSNKRQGPTTCTISVRSTGQYDSTLLDIEVKSMNIQECPTQVAIYDGDGAQHLLMSYDCRSSQNSNRMRFITSRNVATFIMTRQNTLNVNFDIEIVVTPIRGGIDPNSENTFGANYYFDKFPQMAIVGIIGAFYALVLAICTAIIVYCRRSYWGFNKQWETHQLATVKTGTSFETKSPPSNVWSVEMKQRTGPTGQYSRGGTFPNPRTNVAPIEDGDSGVFYNVDTFQKRRLMNDERDKARQRYISSNASYTGPEEDQKHKKSVASQVKPGNRRNKRPPSYRDVVNDRASDQSSDEESEDSSSDVSGTKQSLSSEEDRSERSSISRSGTPSHTETEEDSESDDNHSSRDHGTRARKQKRIPPKNKRRSSDSETGPSRPSQLQHQPLPPPQLQVPYGAYPSAQFIPVMAGHPQYQQVHMVPGYPSSAYPKHPAVVPQVQPTEPPIYSYLVRRGYTPLEAHRNSPTGTGSQHSDRSQVQEPDLRLDSGVEYMQR